MSGDAPRRIPLDLRRETTIGRDRGCTLQILNRAISKKHAVIAWDPKARGFTITSLGKNGTSLDGEPLKVGATVPLPEAAFVELASICALRLRGRGEAAYLEEDARGAGDTTFTFREVPKLIRLELATDPSTVLEIDPEGLSAHVETQGRSGRSRERLKLQRAELEVLRELAVHAGRPVARGALQEVTSERDVSDRLSDSVYRHVSQLKRKLGAFSGCIQAVHGVGYVLEGVRLAS